MKKSDPTGTTEATIEIPETRHAGDFPYTGFWSIVGRSAIDQVQLNNATYQDRQNVTSAIVNLINGPGRIFLADKLWEIGETINLNGNLPLNGLPAAGIALGVVPANSKDNGHLYVAMKCLEKPMQELWSSVMTTTTAYQDAEAIRPTIETALTQLYEEQITLQSILQSMPTDSELNSQANIVNGLSNELGRFVNDRDTLYQQIQTIQEETSSMNNLENEERNLTAVQANSGAFLNERLDALRSANTENRATIHQEAMNIQAEYRETTNRLHAVQMTLSRLRSISNENAVSGMQQLLNVRSLEVETTNANLALATQTLEQMQTAFTQGEAQAIEARTNIDTLTTQIAALQEAYETASSYSAEITHLNDNELIKVFAEHLDGIQAELEELMFMVLRLNQSELLATTDSLMTPVNAVEVSDYQDYLTALSDTSDAFTDDEYTLLRHIADFGYSRSYIPGPSRLYALVSMGPTDRRRAFRVLIEEILTLGSSLEDDGTDRNSPLFTLKIALKKKDNDLREMSQLIDFLTSKRPVIDYTED